jgi:hypothetical protein
MDRSTAHPGGSLLFLVCRGITNTIECQGNGISLTAIAVAGSSARLPITKPLS